MNDFTRKSDAAIATAANTAAAVLSENPAYGVPHPMAVGLGGAGTNLASLIDAAKTAQDAARAATSDKLVGREAALAALTSISHIVYTNGTSDSMLQAIGFSPRATPSRPAMPVTVAGLTAEVSGDGKVAVAWKKNGNRASAIYQIERSLDSGATWAIVASTQKAKASLAGYAPGVPVLFRVTTTNSVGTSLPSGVAGAYVGDATDEAPVTLKLAA